MDIVSIVRFNDDNENENDITRDELDTCRTTLVSPSSLF